MESVRPGSTSATSACPLLCSRLSKMCADDEYILKDGAKTASVHPTRGALQNMLCRMDVYARKKHLIINTGKSVTTKVCCSESELQMPDGLS
eukprot:1156852-Pelagomonas_calceolata.AAC.1